MAYRVIADIFEALVFVAGAAGVILAASAFS